MFTFRLKRTIKLGIKSLWMHGLRSTLTTSGIIFGVSSVIAMLAIGEGASQHAQEQIERLGSQNIIIKTVSPPEEEQSSGQQVVREYGLTYADAERFHNSIPNVEIVVPNRILPQRTWYRNRKVAMEVIGTVPWFPDISTVRLLRGRFLSSIDMHYKQSVCVLDENVVTELFAFDDPMYQDVKIAGQGGANVGNIYIPLTTIKDRFGEITIEFSGSSGGKIEKVELQEIIVKVGSIEEVLPTRDVLKTILDRFHKQDDYQVVVPLELLRQAKRTKLIFSIVLGSIAAISLVVGGIGIMNIMLATVSERTREIGIRRALGAKKRDIIVQFLSETLLLTLAGGILGIILGSSIPYLVTYFGHMPTIITGTSLVLAFGISAMVGITFGLYPAYRAANMDPIESLRHE
ncbi:MAG: ABC transporter permease [Planctomycetota bacterium]|jgi:putative ABC transport system permease protein